MLLWMWVCCEDVKLRKEREKVTERESNTYPAGKWLRKRVMIQTTHSRREKSELPENTRGMVTSKLQKIPLLFVAYEWSVHM